jgi:hypothetical protein
MRWQNEMAVSMCSIFRLFLFFRPVLSEGIAKVSCERPTYLVLEGPWGRKVLKGLEGHVVHVYRRLEVLSVPRVRTWLYPRSGLFYHTYINWSFNFEDF